MTGWEFLHLVLNILTGSSIFLLLIFIGKFFCVSVLENVYDEWDCEVNGWMPAFWSISTGLLVVAWAAYLYDIEPLAVITTVLSTLFWGFYVIFGVIITIRENIVPFFNDLHYSIKVRKQK